MMTNGKDPAEVAKFLSLYIRLKDWCDDQPDAIFQLAIKDGIGNVVLSIDTVTVGVTVSTVKAAVLLALPARSNRRDLARFPTCWLARPPAFLAR
jgi:hypothetical protein